MITWHNTNKDTFKIVLLRSSSGRSAPVSIPGSKGGHYKKEVHTSSKTSHSSYGGSSGSGVGNGIGNNSTSSGLSLGSGSGGIHGNLTIGVSSSQSMNDDGKYFIP